jgi:hypothetical protein
MEVSGHLDALVALSPGKEPLLPTGKEARWAPEPVWIWYQREKFPIPAENQTLITQPVAMCRVSEH